MARPTTPKAPKDASTPTDTAKAGPSAQLPAAGAEDVLYLIDLSGYVFRAYHAIAPLSSSKGEPTHAVMGTVNMIQKVVNDRRPSLLGVAMDSKSTTFRKEMDARYKANRPPPPPDLSQQMARCEEIVRAYNVPVFQFDGVEADDLIATAVKRALEANLKVVIVSSDKDLMQLVHDDDDRVVLWDSMRDRVYGPAEVQAKFGVPPSKVRDFLALTGDTSDNVPGVPGVGPKTASDLLNQYGTLEGVYANLAGVARAKLRESLTASEADARLSQKLVTLKDDCDIAFSPDDLRLGATNEIELRRIYTELEFTRLLDALKPEVQITRSYAAIRDLPALELVIAKARARGVVGVDTETTGLDAMSASLVGMSLSSEPGEGFYIPISHRYLGVPEQLPWETVRGLVAPLLADPAVRKVAHHLKFDACMLARYGAPIEGPIFDTMLASYLLDPETPNGLKELARRELNVTMTTYDEVTRKQRGSQMEFEAVTIEDATAYAAADAEIAMALAQRFTDRLEQDGLGKLMEEVELPLSKVLLEMEMTGVLVDIGQLEALGKRVEADLRSLEAQAKTHSATDFSVRSRDQLEKILFDDLKLPVLKRTPKGGRSTDAEVLEELAEQHALPKVIVDFRELDKLKGTYIDALPKCVNARTGRIHTRFSQTTAATGRLSSHDPNLQNIPIRTAVGKEIRAAFIAPPGHVLVSADYSQVELRVLAHLSGDPELLEAFRTNEDVHARTARLVFGVAKEDVTSEMRRHAKAINFGVIYGMGDAALGKSIGIPKAEAAKFIEAYFARYAGVASFMTKTVEAAKKGEAVRTILGRRRFLPNIHSSNRGLRMEAERVAKNTAIQGTAADILKVAMVRLGTNPVVPGARMILTVHDELVFEVPEADVAVAKERIREEMMGAMKLDVPLVVDVGTGKNWAEAH